MATELLVRLPEDFEDQIAAGALLKGITASFLLHDVCRVEAGNIVLVHTAAGRVGQFLVQWARHLGATVIATVSNEEKAGIARRLGARHAVLYSREDFADAVMVTRAVVVSSMTRSAPKPSFARSRRWRSAVIWSASAKHRAR
jgi:NADPH:quinone reductase